MREFTSRASVLAHPNQAGTNEMILSHCVEFADSVIANDIVLNEHETVIRVETDERPALQNPDISN
jgi:hypothetical protein